MSNPSLKLTVISSERKFNMASLKELWQYRDLIRTFVFRDLVSIYKQTLLGPVWFIIQPLITTFTFTIVFGRLANIPTGGVPSILFFMSGIIYWNYFSECLIKISATFVNNAGLFSKVYFPRLAIPVALIMSNLVKFGIQLAVFAIIYIWKFPASERGIEFNYLNLLYLPLTSIAFAMLSFSLGLYVSSVTIKYRDLAFVVQFGIQLLMYGSAVIYSLNSLKTLDPTFKLLLQLNPLSGIFECVRWTLFGTPLPDTWVLLYDVGFIVFATVFSIVIFSKVEKNSMDII